MMKSIRCKTIIAKISSNFDSLYSSKAKKKKKCFDFTLSLSLSTKRPAKPIQCFC